MSRIKIEQNSFLKKSRKKLFNSQKQLQNNSNYHVENQPQMIQNQGIQKSPNQILEQSRLKVLNSRISKSTKNIQLCDEILKNSNSNFHNKQKLKLKQMIQLKIRTDRFEQYQGKISSKIDKIAKICNQNYGGIENMNNQLSKNALSKQQANQYFNQVIQYYQKPGKKHSNLKQLKLNTSKQSSLPKLRSHSQKNLSKSTSQKPQLNKWYIQPNKRFSNHQHLTKYDWKTQDGIKNVIRTKQFHIKNQKIHELIDDVKEKFNREPLFCKYAKIS